MRDIGPEASASPAVSIMVCSPRISYPRARGRNVIRHERKFIRADASTPIRPGSVEGVADGGAGDLAPSTSARGLLERFEEAASSRRKPVYDSRMIAVSRSRRRHLSQRGAHGFEYPALFRWLDARPDVAPVFLAHDLLPLDFPDISARLQALFRRRFEPWRSARGRSSRPAAARRTG